MSESVDVFDLLLDAPGSRQPAAGQPLFCSLPPLCATLSGCQRFDSLSVLVRRRSRRR